MRKISIFILANIFSANLLGQIPSTLTKLNDACRKFTNSTPHDSDGVYWGYATELDSALLDYLKTSEIDANNFKNERNILVTKSFTNDSTHNHKFKFVSFEISDNDRNGAVSDHLFVQWKAGNNTYKVYCLNNTGHLSEMYLLAKNTILLLNTSLYQYSVSVFTFKNNSFVESNVFPANQTFNLTTESDAIVYSDTNYISCRCEIYYSPNTKTLRFSPLPYGDQPDENTLEKYKLYSLKWQDRKFKVYKMKGQ
jgi:hypothetical protein